MDFADENGIDGVSTKQTKATMIETIEAGL